jgi:hypothetical protein
MFKGAKVMQDKLVMNSLKQYCCEIFNKLRIIYSFFLHFCRIAFHANFDSPPEFKFSNSLNITEY